MNEEARIKLEALLKLELAALTEDDLLFIKARFSYLTSEQQKQYEKIDVEEVKENESYRKLQARAAGLRLKSVGVSREELEKSINKAVEDRINTKPV